MKFQNLSALIVDDEVDICDLLSFTLKKEGMTVFTAFNGSEAIALAERTIPDLIILDRMMPVMNGLNACVELRKNPKLSKSKIIILSALGEVDSQIEGLEIGADDYLSKPIRSELLIAKIGAILRQNTTTNKEKNETILELNEIKIDNSQFLVWKSGVEYKFPRKEFELLFLLMRNSNNVVRRDDILKSIWGEEIIIGDRTIDVHIRKIREKIGDQFIETVKGVGYKFLAK